MARLGIALDLGTSGFRAQAINLTGHREILSTAVTTRHPLPGANVIDHLHFALETGLEFTRGVIIRAVNRVIDHLGIPKNKVHRLAICGNPIQLSMFQGTEIRDLAYAGQRKLDSLGVVAPQRNAKIIKAFHVPGLDLPEETDILIPPAVRHEIGADALAMMIQTGMLEKDDIALTTDYGTNAEMALKVGEVIYTGSTAAGPALEGQQIEYGLLALPGAICDLDFIPAADPSGGYGFARSGPRPAAGRFKTFILDQNMNVLTGDDLDPATGVVHEKGRLRAVGITGTGVVALISQGIKAGLIRIPRILTPNMEIQLSDNCLFSEKDLLEAGKAIGSVRAGHITLCQEAGIKMEDIKIAYMSGASGTYVDAVKARDIGLIPSRVEKILQVGNTSLAMARDMVRDTDELWKMQTMADTMRQNHCMFASSNVFEKVYILELSYWTEGMPWEQYRKFLNKFGFPDLQEVRSVPEVIKTVDRDIPDLGLLGLKIISDIGQEKSAFLEGCTGCRACLDSCPEQAILIADTDTDFLVKIDLARCDGVACRRCERACPEKVFDLVRLITAGVN